MWPSLKPSQYTAVVGSLSPQNGAVGTLSTGWISAANFGKFVALLEVGAMAAGATVDMNIQQAQDATGTGAKALGAAIAQVQQAAAGANTVAWLNVGGGMVDRNNNYAFIQVQVIVGTATAYLAMQLLGFDERYMDGSTANAASIAAQTVG